MAAPLDDLFRHLECIEPPGTRPHITLAYAQSLDGAIAARADERTLLSSPASLALTHALRAHHDAILVGISTVLSDDPELTVRLVEGPNPQPVVLDSRLRTPPQARLFHAPPAPWLAAVEPVDPARREALEALGARVLPMPQDGSGRVHLPCLLEQLQALGVRRLMVEGGSQVLTAFLTQRLADLLVLTIAPRYLGGLPAIPPEHPRRLPHLPAPRWVQLGPDAILWGPPAWEEP